MSNHQTPTLQEVFFVHAREFRARCGIKERPWAERLDAAYCRLVPAEHRSLPAPDLANVTDVTSFEKLRAAWDTYVRRIESGEIRFPVELEEAWLEAMEDPYRTACKRERAQRVGLWGAIRHVEGAIGDHCCFGETVREFGQLTQQMGEILADGSMHSGDAKHLPELTRRIDAMQADLESLKRRAQACASEGQEPLRAVGDS